MCTEKWCAVCDVCVHCGNEGRNREVEGERRRRKLVCVVESVGQIWVSGMGYSCVVQLGSSVWQCFCGLFVRSSVCG